MRTRRRNGARPQKDPLCEGEPGGDRRRGGVPSRGRPRRHADRDGLWPRGRRDLGQGGRGDLRRQGAASDQPTHRPCPGHRGGERTRPCSARRPRRWPAHSGPGLSLWSCLWLRPAGSACSRAPGLDTVAIRSPSHETARALIEAAGVPLAAPSANRSGAVSPTTAAHVTADLDGRVDWILDAGPCRHGLESTIVACLARAAPIAASGSDHAGSDRIRARFADRRAEPRRKPLRTRRGNWRRIMRPRQSFGLARPSVSAEEAALDFGGSLKGGAPRARLDLSPSGDLVEAASHLFSYLRALDAAGAARIAVAPIPEPWAWGGDQRSAPPRGRAARTLNDGRHLPLIRRGLGNSRGERLALQPASGRGVGKDERRPIDGTMNAGLSWDEFRLVKSIAEARSLVGAAERLGVNHSTVFRRLAAVESAVGARLFDRSRAGYEPTAAGEEMIALASTMAESVARIRAPGRRSRRQAGRRVVRHHARRRSACISCRRSWRSFRRRIRA